MGCAQDILFQERSWCMVHLSSKFPRFVFTTTYYPLGLMQHGVRKLFKHPCLSIYLSVSLSLAFSLSPLLPLSSPPLCVCVRTFAHACGAQRATLGIIPHVLPTVLWGRVSQWPSSQPIRLEWMARHSPGPIWPHFRMHTTMFNLFVWVLGSELRSSR